jgi:hypothetical protein
MNGCKKNFQDLQESVAILLDDLSDLRMLYPCGGSPGRLNDVNICVEQTLADPGVRRLLNHAKQLVASDGHIKVWADGLSFANAFSYPRVQLRNVERQPRRDCRWNPAIPLRYSEIRERFARLRTARNELGACM